MLDFLIGNDLLSSIIAFGLVLIPAIFIHELGHFLAAKAVGITVLEFGIGFPPKARRLFMWGETEFTLNWLPIGGFVRPLGEDMVRPLSAEEIERDKEKLQEQLAEQKHQPNKNEQRYISEREELLARGITEMRSVNEVAPLPRIFFMVAGALANFLSAWALFVIIGLIGVDQIAGIRAQIIFQPEGVTVLEEAGISVGDIIEKVNGQTFNSIHEFYLLANESESDTLTLSVVSIETNETYEVTLNRDNPLFQLNSYVRVLSVEENSPGHLSGLLPDDLVYAINGEPITDEANPVATLQQAAVDYAGQPLKLTVLRGAEGEREPVEITVIPREEVRPNQGRIGIGIWDEYHTPEDIILAETTPLITTAPLPLGDAISFGFQRIGETVGLIFEIPSRLVNQSITLEEARPVSVVGISQIGGQFLQESIENDQPSVILNFIAVISVALGITNLLPIPALDGGRILFVLIEIIRGKPITPEREGLIHLAGMIFLLSIGVLIILYDVLNPLTLPQ